ncbi:MAG TPA: hypothetical protein PK495_00810 [Bacteroidales bacterium]|nr:hypothetical protein [Bacteroidales bacterium]
MNNDERIKQKISKSIEEAYNSLDKKLKKWLESYVIEPRKIKVVVNLQDMVWDEVWLITDNKEKYISSYRIVFNPKENAFGLECTLESGIEWYMGTYGTLSETVESM